MANHEPDNNNSVKMERKSGFNVNYFLEENYKLFTILSIFAAITYYIINIIGVFEPFSPLSIAFTSSISLFTLVSLGITRRIYYEIIDVILADSDEESGSLIEKLELFIFSALFLGLLLSFLAYAISIAPTFRILSNVGLLFVTISGIMMLFTLIMEKIGGSRYTTNSSSPSKTFARSLVLLVLSLLFAAVGWKIGKLDSGSSYMLEYVTTLGVGFTLASIPFGLLSLVEILSALNPLLSKLYNNIERI